MESRKYSKCDTLTYHGEHEPSHGMLKYHTLTIPALHGMLKYHTLTIPALHGMLKYHTLTIPVLHGSDTLAYHGEQE
jgi:hypothetical protein